MSSNKVDYVEDMLFKYVDEFRMLFFPEQWASVFLECSKNEILALILLYRQGEVNMTEIAEYIAAPLNTATGVVSRLEKKQLAQRMRDNEDKRIVKISLTTRGKHYFEEEKTILIGYFEKFISTLTNEEEKVLFSCMAKLLTVLKTNPSEENSKQKKKVKHIMIE